MTRCKILCSLDEIFYRLVVSFDRFEERFSLCFCYASIYFGQHFYIAVYYTITHTLMLKLISQIYMQSCTTCSNTWPAYVLHRL